MTPFSWFVVLGQCISLAYSYNILAVLPVPSKSHYATIDPILMKLSEKGHNVTVYNPYVKKETYANYNEVDTSMCFRVDTHYNSIEMLRQMSSNNLKAALMLFLFVPTLKQFQECPPFVELLNSTMKYDLLITESFCSDLSLIFAIKFKIPFITYIPNMMLPWLYDRMANPYYPSYIPHLVSGFLTPMTFFQRVENVLLDLIGSILYPILITGAEDQIIKHYLGSSSPSLQETILNTSLIFINSHESIHPSIPLVPAVVPIGGINIKPSSPLPKDIEKFINESTHGVVYFCMGSLLRGESFPEDKRNAFLYAFSKIKQRVLWKWEGDELPGKANNIMISKWMPQRDILAHPNVKLFISHGGLLGTSEAVYEGVPVLGIPIFGDQRTNVKSLEANGAGELLEYEEISKDLVLEKIQRLLSDPKFKKNAQELSVRFRDRPLSPLDTAVYWTEYVIRHKGAPHLKTAAVNMPWYQYLLLDVTAFLFLFCAIVIVMLYYSVKFSIKLLCRAICKKNSNRDSKSNDKVKRS